MLCPQKLATLPCDKTGVGYISQPLSCDQTKLRLMEGHQGNSCNTDTLQLIFENGQNGAPVYFKRVNGKFVMQVVD